MIISGTRHRECERVWPALFLHTQLMRYRTLRVLRLMMRWVPRYPPLSTHERTTFAAAWQHLLSTDTEPSPSCLQRFGTTDSRPPAAGIRMSRLHRFLGCLRNGALSPGSHPIRTIHLATSFVPPHRQLADTIAFHLGPAVTAVEESAAQQMVMLASQRVASEAPSTAVHAQQGELVDQDTFMATCYLVVRASRMRAP